MTAEKGLLRPDFATMIAIVSGRYICETWPKRPFFELSCVHTPGSKKGLKGRISKMTMQTRRDDTFSKKALKPRISNSRSRRCPDDVSGEKGLKRPNLA